MNLRRRPLLVGLIIALVAPLAAATLPRASGDTTVIVVRHAEKESGDDPGLTPAGVRRAEALADVLSKAGVSAIYATEFRRTKATAAPLAKKLGLEVGVISVQPNAAAYVGAVAERIRRDHRGQVVLVVGHSNTSPAVVNALGAGAVPAIDDVEHDHLFVVTIPEQGPVRLIRARYSVPPVSP